ncbi:hypothetical protein L3Y34_019670 [Caenorhabditis briggsae]|uniref:BTB domain-containing protein n=1 Tax=Caenorhabditis briggsae TaxID=6238 RepID=A0AAE9DNM3_CAEBR|nr:hypothetical protein L3Y34_019670 [Caenorhabditis briggsae]
MEIDIEMCGDVEDHLGMSWKIRLLRKDQKLKVYLDCLEKIDNPESLISTGGKFKFNGKEQIFFHDFTKIENSKLAILEYWSQNSNYLKNGSAEIEFLVEIDTEKSIGVKIGKEKSRIFDDDVAKEVSDVVLTIAQRKFYVSKLTLASQSTYFKTLFLGKFVESEKSIIELKDIDPHEFQIFLEFLYGESVLNDETVYEILKLADMYDVKTANRQCEKFLLADSEKSIKDKLTAAAMYNLENLKAVCLSEIKTVSDLRSIVPEESSQFDTDVWMNLFLKLLSFSK